MKFRKLGNTDMEISCIGFGCWAIADGKIWGHQVKKDALAALQSAHKNGVNFFDTAEVYGNGLSEQLLGEALKSVRKEIIIATKPLPKHFGSVELEQACDQSLRNLRTDRIDLYQLHWPNPEIPIAETLGVLEKLIKKGKILAYGVSNFGKQDLSACIDVAGAAIASDQLAYNLLFRAVEYEIQSLCKGKEISILCYSPLLQGLLTGKFATADDVPETRARSRHFSSEREFVRHGEQGAEEETFAALKQIADICRETKYSMADLSLAWLLAQPGITSAIVGARNAIQAERNTHAADLVLADGVLERLSLATEGLKSKLGNNPDLWQAKSRII